MSWDDINFFHHDNFRLAYREEGKGEPIVLIHGFASSSKTNWVTPGWFKTLSEAGYHVIAMDNRGHGESDKSYDEKDYTPENMAADISALLEHLSIDKAHIMGYSMGARIAAFMALRASEKIQTLIFGGLGIGMVLGAGHWQPVRDALLAEDIKMIKSTRGLMFRKFADQTKSDRHALAACVISSKKELTEEQVSQIALPTLVVVGEHDDISGKAEPLAALLEKGSSLTIPKRDHMHAVGDKLYKKAAIEFLKCHPLY